MGGDRPDDPVGRRAGNEQDTYEVSDWEERTHLDRLASSVYTGLVLASKIGLVALAVTILMIELVISGVALLNNPWVGSFTVLSVIPALGLAAFIWERDITSPAPIAPLVATFILGIVFASFAGVFNTVLRPLFDAFPVFGTVAFFFIIVAPVEEFVKLLSVRLFAYSHHDFDAVIDGAVYGAMAGLGFATIENLIYINQQYLEVHHLTTLQTAAPFFQTAALRTLAGPGHVIYSAIAGYYLGLAKFNPENWGPIVVKGLLIAIIMHATYNTLVTYIPTPLSALFGIPPLISFVAYVLVFDLVAIYILYRKIGKYRETYEGLYD